jgi:hypothetical protein
MMEAIIQPTNQQIILLAFSILMNLLIISLQYSFVFTDSLSLKLKKTPKHKNS